ncbi:MAG: hypothetical protein JNJ76_09055 [Candidatus Competibacter sp.]|nr:hypothetical protein [Candidatus Competibacter sp.]
MKIGEAIQQLQALQEQHGDVEISFSYSIRVADGDAAPVASQERKEMRAARMAICLECDRHEVVTVPLTRIEFVRCKECGCAVNAKARLLKSSCPLGKW